MQFPFKTNVHSINAKSMITNKLPEDDVSGTVAVYGSVDQVNNFAPFGAKVVRAVTAARTVEKFVAAATVTAVEVAAVAVVDAYGVTGGVDSIASKLELANETVLAVVE